MTTKSLLVLGGTGQISAACVREATDRGHRVTVFNRGSTTVRRLPAETEIVTVDVHDEEAVRAVLGGRHFDSVADFLTFTPAQAAAAVRLFGAATGQYVFVGSASAYQKPPQRLPIGESTPLFNPYSTYARDKIACERLLRDEHAAGRITVTCVRPSHTYDRTHVPLLGGWTVVDRMRRGLPIVLHGDGTSPWAMTHADDFARAFVPLLGEPTAVGEAYNIMSPELLTWNTIALDLADAAGVEVPRIVHRTTHDLVTAAPEWDADLRGDRSHAAIFDIAKIHEIVPGWEPRIPFAEGARQIVRWYDQDPARRRLDPAVDALYDRLCADPARGWAESSRSVSPEVPTVRASPRR